MKNHSTDLYELICSMTKSERRYFKLQVAKNKEEETDYLTLYNLLEKEKVYNEKDFITQNAHQSWISHLPVLKKQLYQYILDCLHRFDAYAHPEQHVRRGIHFCALLLKKGLFDQCKKQISKYKHKAYELEKFENVIELIELEKQMLNKTHYQNIEDNYLEALQNEANQCLQYIELSGAYWVQSSIVYKWHYEKKINLADPNNPLDKLVSNAEFKAYGNSKTFKPQLDFLQINALHAFSYQQKKDALAFNKSFLTLLDSSPKIKYLYADRYFSVLNNYLIDCLLLERFEELLDGIKTLRAIPSQAEFKHIGNLDANVFRLGNLLELNYLLSTEKMQEGKTLAIQTVNKLPNYKSKIVNQNIVTFHYLNALFSFNLNEYNQCLSDLETIFNNAEILHTNDLYLDSHMLQLLCHYQLGNHLLVESLINAQQRRYSSLKSKFETHKIVLGFVRKSIQKITSTLVIQTKEKLINLKEKEPRAHNNINYLKWLEGVI